MILKGNQIKELRKARRMTQTELAKRTGLSASAISQFEAGTRNATQETSDRIATALNEVSPMASTPHAQTAELNDDETLIQMDGVTLRPSEKALLKALASAMLAQRN